MGGPLQAGLLMELGFPSWKRGARPAWGWEGAGYCQALSPFVPCGSVHMSQPVLRMEGEVGLLILLSPQTRKWDPCLPSVRLCWGQGQ